MAEVSKNGDLFYWKIKITNLGADDNTHVKFTPTVPSLVHLLDTHTPSPDTTLLIADRK